MLAHTSHEFLLSLDAGRFYRRPSRLPFSTTLLIASKYWLLTVTISSFPGQSSKKKWWAMDTEPTDGPLGSAAASEPSDFTLPSRSNTTNENDALPRTVSIIFTSTCCLTFTGLTWMLISLLSLKNFNVGCKETWTSYQCRP